MLSSVWTSFVATELADHLWQATLFALAAWAVTWLLRGTGARWRYVVWWMALAKFLLPASLVMFVLRWCGVDPAASFSLFEGAEGHVEMIVQLTQPAAAAWASTITEMQSAESASSGGWIGGVLAFGWAAVAGVLVWRQRRNWRATTRALRRGQMARTGRAAEALRRACLRLGRQPSIDLVFSPEFGGPGVWGVRRPVIVLPAGVVEQLGDAELEAVLIHELAHIRRRDTLAGALQSGICALFWFHPLVWMIDRRLLAEREMACDEDVLGRGDQLRDYAGGLWKIVEFSLRRPAPGAARAAGSDLKRRIENMRRHKGESGWAGMRACGFIFALAMLALALGFLHHPNGGVDARTEEQSGTIVGVGGGIGGGVPGGVSGGISGGIAGGVPGGIAVGQRPPPPPPPPPPPAVLNDKWKAIETAPEYPVKYENPTGSPLVITDARVRAMIGEESRARRSAGQTQESYEGIAKFNISFVNQTDRRIRTVIVRYENPDLRGRAFNQRFANVNIEPHGVFNFGINSLHHHIVSGRTPNFEMNFTFFVVGVIFEQAPHWMAGRGEVKSIRELDELLKPPPPPPPPPRP